MLAKAALALVVVLVTAASVAGDGYLYPQPPPQFDEPPSSPAYPPPFQDEIPQLMPTYLPPLYPPIGTPPITDDNLRPFDDTIVIPAPPSNQYLPPLTTKQTPIQILNMSCLDTGEGNGYFRVFFRTNTKTRNTPVVDSSPNDCVVNAFGGDVFRIDLEGQRMVNCGIRPCGVRMCLVVRMATVPGLRLADDSSVTLQCIPQETVVSQTKHLRLNAHAEQGRSSSRSILVASGGNQRKFESLVMLLRRNNGVFDQPIQQGSAVRLGDELLLRTAVRDGDGWKHGRMGSVIIRSASSQRSVVLVDEDGCRNPSVKTICPQQPQQVAPLTIQFPFRAFLFQGAAPADDLLLSVRMSACLRSRDCYMNKICEDNAGSRTKRTAVNDSVGLVTDWESQFQFRVLPRDAPGNHPKNSTWLIVSLGVVSLILGCCVLGLVVRPVKERIYL